MIPFTEIHELLPRTKDLLCPVIAPIFIVESINVPNAFIENG